jgi:hypothetical protein
LLAHLALPYCGVCAEVPCRAHWDVAAKRAAPTSSRRPKREIKRLGRYESNVWKGATENRRQLRCVKRALYLRLSARDRIKVKNSKHQPFIVEHVSSEARLA